MCARGGQLVWEIVDVEPGRRLVYREGPGILPVATEVTVVFEEAEAGTRLTVTQSGFGEGVDWQAQIDNVGLGRTQTLAALDLYLRTGVRLDRFFTFRSDLASRPTTSWPGHWSARSPTLTDPAGETTS